LAICSQWWELIQAIGLTQNRQRSSAGYTLQYAEIFKPKGQQTDQLDRKKKIAPMARVPNS
jgi:hypothetical protein